MDWKTGLREMVEKIIHVIEHDEKVAWGVEDESHLIYEFPTAEKCVVEINGEKHILDVWATLDGELCAALKYQETDSQFQLPKTTQIIHNQMLKETYEGDK